MSERCGYRLLILTLLTLVGGLRGGGWIRPSMSFAADVQPAADRTYVGRAACVPCHQTQVDQFTGSHHDRAMEIADAGTVLGDFKDASFTYNGVTTTFFRRGDAFLVRTDGADGALHEYPVAYTFGIDPLQQYLVEFPDGRLQALSICWDTRPKTEGGQRWFHLYPNEKVDFRDVLHWTGPAQNWNHMCAECHSTNVRKNYRATEKRFETKWSELDVSCEACHGPASKHLAWARDAAAGRAVADPSRGLAVDLKPRGGTWGFDADNAIARLSAARDTRGQVVCARCHSRRAQISEDYHHGQPLEQTHILSLLDEGLYQADGQILDEVYEYGSFLQSRMHEKGVVCGDCHDPHSGRLRKDGNTLCAQCHQPARYDTTSHHHHKAGTEAARCVQCHMPTRNYMVVDARHDHSFRVPRPDLSASLGTPNVCTSCHGGRSADWAAAAIVSWYGPTRAHGSTFATALDAGRKHQAGADQLLTAVIADQKNPAIVRATALSLLEDSSRPATKALVEQSLRDSDALVRRAAVALLLGWEAKPRWDVGGPLLSDSIRAVRIEAVNTLVDTAAQVSLTPGQKTAFERAVADYRSVQAFNADRAESWLNLGALEVRLGSPELAAADYQKAIGLQPQFIPPYINLADLYREQGRDADGERVLRQLLAIQPGSADAHHALGLSLVRQKRREEALTQLAQAAEANPQNARYVYVYAVALSSFGDLAKARSVLAQAQPRFSGDRDILMALVQWSVQAEDRTAAGEWAQKLQGLNASGAPPAPVIAPQPQP